MFISNFQNILVTRYNCRTLLGSKVRPQKKRKSLFSFINTIQLYLNYIIFKQTTHVQNLKWSLLLQRKQGSFYYYLSTFYVDKTNPSEFYLGNNLAISHLPHLRGFCPRCQFPSRHTRSVFGREGGAALSHSLPFLQYCVVGLE